MFDIQWVGTPTGVISLLTFNGAPIDHLPGCWTPWVKPVLEQYMLPEQALAFIRTHFWETGAML